MTDAWLAMGRTAMLAGVLLLAGSAVSTWLAPTRAVRRPLQMAGALLLLGLGLQLVGQLRAFDAFLPDADPLADTVGMIARTSWGRNRAALGTLGVLTLLAGLVMRTRRPTDWSTRVLALLALGLLPRLGHAAAVEDGVVRAYLLALAHASAASIWLGTLALLARGWWTGVSSLRAAVAPYGRLALVAAPVTLVSGVVTAWPRFGRVVTVLDSGYGQLLAVKIAVVVVILGLGAQHHRRLVRGGVEPTRGTLLAEVLLAVLVLTITGWLAESAPPAG
jgi:putative copper export protein